MRVLVVDDEQVTRTLLRRILEKNLFCEVRDAETGAAGWGAIQEVLAAESADPSQTLSPPYDLCVLDVMMPQGNGLELLTRIRSEPRLADVKVILCSSITARTALSQFTAFRPDGNILKPFTVPSVLAEIKRVMSLGRASS